MFRKKLLLIVLAVAAAPCIFGGPTARAQWQTFAAPWSFVSTLFGRDILPFALVPRPAPAGHVLMAGGSSDGVSGLFRSDDNGRTWTFFEPRRTDGTPAIQGNFVPWIGVLPGPSGADSSDLYMTVARLPHFLDNYKCDLLRSTNLGTVWSVVASNTPACVIRIDPAARVMYALEIGYGSAFFATIHRSRDLGVSWEATPYPRHPPNALRIDSDGTLYAVASVIRVSRDQGTSWTVLPDIGRSVSGQFNVWAADLAVWHAPGGATIMIAATNDGLYKSTDAGTTWTPNGLQGFDLDSLDIAAATSTEHLQIRVGWSAGGAAPGHGGLVLLSGDTVMPLSNGLPGPAKHFVPKEGSYAFSAGAIHVCEDVPSCVGGTLPEIGTLVEFHNTLLDHYFMTLNAAEAAGIDNGAAGPGWTRTGQTFRVYTNLLATPFLTAPACRFYGTPGIGPNSHFFSADADECALVSDDAGWSLETDVAFAAATPYRQCSNTTGVPICGPTCDRGMVVYRLYNNGFARGDSNHRYVKDLETYEAMRAQGWIGEGTRMCTAQ